MAFRPASRNFDGQDASPSYASEGSGHKKSIILSGEYQHGLVSSSRKEFLRKFIDSELLTKKLKVWFSGVSKESGFSKPAFDVPFELTELQNFDYALEGVSFQQLLRMPNALYESTADAVEAAAYLAIEDFLHAGVKGLWETFWAQNATLPFSVACIHSNSSKFYPAEKAIARGKLDGLCATAIMLKSKKPIHGRWDHILALTLPRPAIYGHPSSAEQRPSSSIFGEALFFAIRILLSRSLSRSNTIFQNSKCVYLFFVDSLYGGVVKVEGDVNKLDIDNPNVYECASDWIKFHAKISVSPIDQVWNKVGNANWGDIGTLQILLALFYSIVQFYGIPRFSIEEVAAEHALRVQSRRNERHLVDMTTRENGLFHLHQGSVSPEIVELQEETAKIESREQLNLEVGSVLWLEDSNQQKGFQINEVITDGEALLYNASPLEESSRELLLYFGSRPHSDPAWDDMSLWYQVQRQTKILSLMKQRGISSKYLPQVVASGRIIHPGECNKKKSGENCGHPWCGSPILVVSPSGHSVFHLIKNGLFDAKEALRCCHDCLSALATAESVGIRHGNICPENVISVRDGECPVFVLIGWGHAVLEDKDRPSMNLFFSSTYALQEGKLYSASDAESLIYFLYFACGGGFPDFDSVEGALRWREESWSKRVIQQKLGEVSALLKAFADYVDSLCGTPYPFDYNIWLRRLKRTLNDEDHGKEIVVSG